MNTSCLVSFAKAFLTALRRCLCIAWKVGKREAHVCRGRKPSQSQNNITIERQFPTGTERVSLWCSTKWVSGFLCFSQHFCIYKRQNPLISLFFFVTADGLEAKFSPERDLSMIVFGWPCVLRHCLNFARLSLNLVFKELVLSVDETVFNAGWMARIEVYVLTAFSRFAVSFDVKMDLFLNILPLNTTVSRKIYLSILNHKGCQCLLCILHDNNFR